MPDSALRLEDLGKRFGATVAVDCIDLDVGEGEFVTLLGPSGCGKTTTLGLVAGFTTPTQGRIFLRGKSVADLPPFRRDVGVVFQDYALFPHMSAQDNVAFGLAMRNVAKAEREGRVKEALELVQLEGLGERRPLELSGGQRQRVALARAMVIRPTLLLLDEPLSNLDLKLREEMRVEIAGLQRRLGITTLFVTHDQGEALAMSDRIAVMNAGRIEQTGTPSDIYERPATRFVAEFIGRMNFFTDGRDSVAIRPERATLASEHGANGFVRHCSIVSVIYLGSTLEYRVRFDDGVGGIVEATNDGGAPRFRVGDSAWFVAPLASCVRMPAR
ncbi:MAG TPA: ABC transporter ATP-binding protein [Casimicrobiaceae bacterium]|nr:ABC transporter ATP-binding protein [Casimicrobiaceae bacterium]